MELYTKIKALRLSKGLTQTQVAEKIGMAQPNYALAEKGKKKINIEKIEKLAELFEVSVSELLSFENTTTQTQENNNVRLQELEKENENLKKELENINEKFSYLKQINDFQASEIEDLKTNADEMRKIVEVKFMENNKSEIITFLLLCESKENINDYFLMLINKYFGAEQIEIIIKFKLFGFDKGATPLFFKNFERVLSYVLSLIFYEQIIKEVEEIKEMHKQSKNKEKVIVDYFYLLFQGRLNDKEKWGTLTEWLYPLYLEAIKMAEKKNNLFA